MIPKEMKYNLYYGDVRGDVLPPPHGSINDTKRNSTQSTRITLALQRNEKVTKPLFTSICYNNMWYQCQTTMLVSEEENMTHVKHKEQNR